MGGRGGGSGFSSASKQPSAPTSAAETKDLHELAEYMRNLPNGIRVDESSLSGTTFENVREAAAGVERIMNEFPQAADVFHELRGESLSHGVLANASYDGIIRLGKHYYAKTEDGLNQTYDANVSNGYHPAGTAKADIATHEAGHILERALIEKNILSKGNDVVTRNAAAIAWNKSQMASQVISEAAKMVKKTAAGKGMKIADMIHGVSRYAERNRSETLAECVADYTANGAKAQPLSVAVWNILKRELG